MYKKMKSTNSRRASLDSKESEQSTDPFSKNVAENPAFFYRKFVEQLAIDKADRQLAKEVENAERRKARQKGDVSELEKKKKWEEFIARYHEMDNEGTKAAAQTIQVQESEDSILERLRTEFYWLLFNTAVVYKTTVVLKEYLEKVYEKSTAPPLAKIVNARGKISSSTSIGNFQTTEYSITARTIMSCFSIWCGYLIRRLTYKELEVFTASPDHPTPSFKEVSIIVEPSQLTNFSESLVFSGPAFRLRTPRNHSRLNSNVSLEPFDHALPELGTAKKGKNEGASTTSFFKSIDPIWLKQRNQITLFEKDEDSSKLWRHLTSDESIMPRFKSSKISKTVSQENLDLSFKTAKEESVYFSTEIEIVRSKEAIRSFCVDKNNPSNLAYATGKAIREINVEHSIRYRKRNVTMDKLLDDEANTWEGSLHRYDALALQDTSNMKSASHTHAHIPSNSALHLVDFLHTAPNDTNTEQIDTLDSSISDLSRANKFVGIGSEASKHQNVAHMALNKLKKRLTMGRRPSFTSHSPSASHFKKHSVSKNKKKTVSVDHNQPAIKLATHPFLPFYVSGGVDGSIHMWQYGISNSLRTYREQSSAAITNIKFSRFGYKFGATDSSGVLTLWRFEASKDSMLAFDALSCHSGRAVDFGFLDSGSVVATVGISSSGQKSMKVWDLLLPHYESCTYSHKFTEDPTTLLYSPKYKTIMVGTRRGEINVFDLRSQNKVHTVSLHSGGSVDTLSLDMTEDFFVSGSSDGDVQVWDTRYQQELHRFTHAHSKHNFFNLEGSYRTVSSLGVTDCDIGTSFMYSSGADGRIIRRTII